MIIINCHKPPQSSHPTLVYGTHPNPYNAFQAMSPTATPISHSSRRGSVTIDSSSSWISVELKSKQRKCNSSFVPRLDWTDTGGCLAPVLWTPSNAKLLDWILNQCICPLHNLEIKYQETWQSLPLLKTCSKTPPCKITQRLSSSTKCLWKYSNLQHHEHPERWKSGTTLDTASQEEWETTEESQEEITRSK